MPRRRTITKKANRRRPISSEAVDDPVAIARAEVERLNEQEHKFATLYREGSAALAGIRAKRGRQVLDANDPSGAAGEINQRIRAAEDELAAMAEAAAEARRARLPAIASVIAAEADAKERRAMQLDTEASKLAAESDRLRAALEAHDDWGYFPAEGKVNDRYFPAVLHGGGEFRVVDARGPKFMRLRNEAQALKSQAAQGRFRQPERAGSVEADNLEALLAAVYADPMRIGPSAAEIIAWFELSVDKERRRRSRTHSTEDAYAPSDTPMRFHLEWRAGTIDQAQSHILATSATSPVRSPFVTGPTQDELEREAANRAALGLPNAGIEQVAKELGAPAPVGVVRVAPDSQDTIAKLGPLSEKPADPYQLAQVEDA